MMFKMETKEDFDELMLGQEKFKNFIEVNKSQNEKDKCATDQKILINRLIRSGQMPKLIICDFENVLSKTNIFDFTNEDGSTTVKLNEWHEYIANSAIKDFDALLKNEQIHFSDDNGGPLMFCCWVSRLSSNSIKNFNDIIARNDITLKKSDESYTVFNEFKDKLANESIKNLNFIIDESGKVTEDNLGFKDFIKDATNLRYFAPEAFNKIDLDNPEHRSLLGIKSKEEPDKIIFGWNLLGYIVTIFSFGLAYLFGWSQKLFANAIANDWYNGSYISRLQARKKDVEIVVEPIKTATNISMQSEQWESKSDGEIIQAQAQRISKIKIVGHKKDIEHEGNATKNNIDLINTNKGTLNSENEYEQKTINTDYSNNDGKKTAEKSSGKQTKTGQSTQVNKNVEPKTKKNIIKNNNESGQLTNEPSNKQTKTGQSTQVNKNVELKHEKNITGNSTNTIKMDNKVLNSKNDNKNESGQKIVNSSKKGNNQTTKKDDIHKQELSKGHNTKKNQTAKNDNSAKTHITQDGKKSTNEPQKHKQNYGIADFLADFDDATNMNFIFLNNQDAQRQLQDKLRKLCECRVKYNEIFEANKDALQKYESKHKIKIVNKIDYFITDTKSELDNRQKKLMETTSLNKPFLTSNGPFQIQKLGMMNETWMGNNLFENNPYLTKKSISEPPQTKEVQKLNYIVDEEDEII